MQEVSQVVQENMRQAQINQKFGTTKKFVKSTISQEIKSYCYCMIVHTSSNDNGELHTKSYGS